MLQILLHRKHPMTDFHEAPVKPTTINTKDSLAISSLHSPAAFPSSTNPVYLCSFRSHCVCFLILMPSLTMETSLHTWPISTFTLNSSMTFERNPGLQSTEENQFLMEDTCGKCSILRVYS